MHLSKVIVIWCEMPETADVWVGKVTAQQFARLLQVHQKFINGENERADMCSWFYDKDGQLTLGTEWNLKKVEEPIKVEGTLIVTGFYL